MAGSNCTYKKKFSLKAAENSTKSGPCTNRPIGVITFQHTTTKSTVTIQLLRQYSMLS